MGNVKSSGIQEESDSKEPLLETEDEEEDDDGGVLATLIHQLNSFIAVLWPVFFTMILTSLVACHVSDESTKENMSSYLYYREIDTGDFTTAQKTLQALTNALMIIIFIAAITFLIVILYKFNFMKGLVGYLILSSSILLGCIGSVLVRDIALDIMDLAIDTYSFTFVMYNFAIVGTTSIFYQKGIPEFVGRFYLIATSVIMAWQLCQWPEWSVWTILCMLAFWDLFAVLTPCGPLRCLVNMISKEGRPMPGLLYEAEVHETHSTPAQVSKMLDLDYYSKDRPEECVIHVSQGQTHVERKKLFEAQVQEFYADYNPNHVVEISTLVNYYIDHEMDLWEKLYDKYAVRHVPMGRSYPSVELVKSLTSKVETSRGGSTIKLGLGDFIFYSVLVGRASMRDFSCFVACIICVIAGLAVTMYLLAQFKALPALPISILLAVTAYLLTGFVSMDLLDEVTQSAVML